MGSHEDALKAALDSLFEQYDKEEIERALADRKRRRGRPKGSAKYRDGDAELMLEAYDEYLRMIARYHRDPAGRHPKPSTYAALKRVAKRTWPECRGGASTPEAVARRLNTRFKRV